MLCGIATLLQSCREYVRASSYYTILALRTTVYADSIMTAITGASQRAVVDDG
jgi:hypothetical protein